MNASTHAELTELVQRGVPQFDLASVEEVTARANRVAKAQHAARIRHNELSDARQAYRTHGVRDPLELLLALQNIESSITDQSKASWMAPFQERLLELVTDMDAELNQPPPSPERLAARDRRIADTEF